jgi:DNA-binding XRE family transcriptional regulator
MSKASEPNTPIMGNGIRFYRERRLAESEGREGKAKFSQQAIADNVGITRQRFGWLESGEMVPTPEEIEGIAKYLEVNPGLLYTQRQIELIYELWKNRC